MIFTFRDLFKDHPWRISAALFCVAFGVFLSIQLIPGIPDPDSFYHIAMAQEIRDHGVVKDFYWLGDFTVLGGTYADQHFLYHVFLIPFVTFLPPFVGAKLATAILASLSIVVVYLLFRALEVRWAAWVAALLLLVNPYTFRMGLIKAPSLGVIGVFLLLLFAARRRFAALFVASACFVWAYGAFPLAFGAVGLYALTQGVASWKTHGRRKISRRSRLKRLWRNEGRLVICSFLGIIAGLVSSPYFPKNLRFYWIQTIQIAVVNFRGTIGVGGEWYPY
ncbi:MAG: hypothetical protein HYV34_01480 [Candidatus Kerfeldbacteria bacterium]|nr:hypothetical protein [Candidatus Kerfeldbacteria bacterium]